MALKEQHCRRLTAAAITIVGLGLLGAAFLAPSALAIDTPANLYECRPIDPNIPEPPPLPKLSPEVEEQLKEAEAVDDFKPLCPAGEVPNGTSAKAPEQALRKAVEREYEEAGKTPTGRMRVLGKSKRRAHGPSRTSQRKYFSPWWYSWALGEQALPVPSFYRHNGIWMSMTNESPYIPYGSPNEYFTHSETQLWGTRAYAGCESYVETGDMKDIGQYKGSTEPHLFISAWDCGAFLGFAGEEYGAPFVQSSPYIFPGSVITHNDVFHVYGARMDGNNWWFYYDGQWVGYIPHSAWTSLFPNYLDYAQFGGEVSSGQQYTCTDMGYNGLFGTNGAAAMIGNSWYEYNYQTQTKNANLSSFASDYSNYRTGLWSANPANKFRYGGPGWC